MNVREVGKSSSPAAARCDRCPGFTDQLEPGGLMPTGYQRCGPALVISNCFPDCSFCKNKETIFCRISVRSSQSPAKSSFERGL